MLETSLTRINMGARSAWETSTKICLYPLKYIKQNTRFPRTESSFANYHYFLTQLEHRGIWPSVLVKKKLIEFFHFYPLTLTIFAILLV